MKTLHWLKIALWVAIWLPCALLAEEKHTFVGVVDWNARLELTLPLSGVVDSVAVEVGSQVKAGQVLLRLDPRPLQIVLDAAQATMRSAEAELAEARREMERVQELYDQLLIAKHEYEQTRAAQLRAEAQAATAKATLAQARLDLQYSQLQAPMPGLVLARNVHPGQAINNECSIQSLFILADTAQMRVRLELSPQALTALKVGQAVNINIGAAQYPGNIAWISAEIHADKVPVEVVFKPPQPVRAGETAAVTL